MLDEKAWAFSSTLGQIAVAFRAVLLEKISSGGDGIRISFERIALGTGFLRGIG